MGNAVIPGELSEAHFGTFPKEIKIIDIMHLKNGLCGYVLKMFN